MQRKPSENGTGRLNFLNWGQVRPIFRGELAVREYPPKYSVFVQVFFMFYHDKSQLNHHLVGMFLWIFSNHPTSKSKYRIDGYGWYGIFSKICRHLP